MVVTEEWYEAWESMLAASLYAWSVCPQVALRVASKTMGDWNVVVVAAAAGSGGAELNVRYHPTLNLSFAMMSPVSSGAADP